jgi:hypothetical protein
MSKAMIMALATATAIDAQAIACNVGDGIAARG